VHGIILRGKRELSNWGVPRGRIRKGTGSEKKAPHPPSRGPSSCGLANLLGGWVLTKG